MAAIKPGHLRFWIPIIEILKSLGGSGQASEVADQVVERMKIPDEELNETLQSGGSKIYNQISWARFLLVRLGYLNASQRGVWTLTENGYNANLNEDNFHKELKELKKQRRLERKLEKQAKDSDEDQIKDEDNGDDLDYREELLNLLKSLPADVTLVAAAKTRTADEVQAVIEAGVSIIGYNYYQEAEHIYQIIGNKVKWHMIGHLQKNKVKKAVELFDMIETIDSFELAELIDRQCSIKGKIMPVLVEINSGREVKKAGVLPEDTRDLIKRMSRFHHLRVQGLMTMGPFFDDPEDYRPLFKEVKSLFNEIKAEDITNINMQYLSMGMSDSYQVAIEEGANIIRIGTKLFGPRMR